ncbi:MAG: phage tail protein, partial [Lachnospiraceae bacterium]|nr:phage tail protein [Lachnospiraceae bacterium]
MGLPDIVIEFSKKAVVAIQSGALGIVGIILKDAKNNGAMVLRGIDEIPTGDSAFSEANTAYIERAFKGAPSKVIVYTLPQDAENYNEAFKYFSTVKVNYLCGAPDISSAEAEAFATWIAGVRKNTVRRPVAILPNVKADNKAVISFKVVNATAEDKIEVEDAEFTEAEYCSRIAGLIAG